MALFLITGGCGFVGSGLVRQILSAGDRVRVLDNLSTGSHENLAGLPLALASRCEVMIGDILDGALLDRALVGVDYILHQAAIPSVPWSLERPLDCQRINAQGTAQVLEAARRNGHIRRFVFAASCAAYGDLDADAAKRETDPVAPLSPYAAAKLAGEQLCTAYARAFDLPTVVLRYFNVFGPRQDPASPYAAVVPRFVLAALRGERPTVYGDGQQTRDFCFLDNVVTANLQACAAPVARVQGRVLNIGCGQATSLLDLLARLSGLVGRTVVPQHAPGRPGEVRHSRANIDAARQAIGYVPSQDVTAGLGLTLSWYQERLQASGALCTA
jgi:UDP-glucose 4-epimerase